MISDVELRITLNLNYKGRDCHGTGRLLSVQGCGGRIDRSV